MAHGLPSDINAHCSLQGNALGQVLAKNGSFLKRLDLFDHVEFGVSAKDAQYLAVAARKLVELVRPLNLSSARFH
jgi:hypothetical protein